MHSPTRGQCNGHAGRYHSGTGRFVVGLCGGSNAAILPPVGPVPYGWQGAPQGVLARL